MKKIYAFGCNEFGQVCPDILNINGQTRICCPYELTLGENPVKSETTTASGTAVADDTLNNSGRISHFDSKFEVKSLIQPSWSTLFFIKSDGSLYIQGFSGKQNVSTLHLDKINDATDVACSWNNIYVTYKQGHCEVFPNGEWNNGKTVKNSDIDCCDEAKNEVCHVKLNSVSSGQLHTIAVTECGQAVYIEENVIFRPLNLHLRVKAVSCGKEHVLLLTRIGAVLSYGLGSRGQLGTGGTENVNEPCVIEALEGISMTRVAAGGWHSVAVSDSGDLYVWGWNESGQLGLPCKSIQQSGPSSKIQRQEPINLQTLPTVLDLPGTEEDVMVMEVSCGSRHTATITDKEKLFTWGWNAYGQLGHGDTVSRDQPTCVEQFSGSQVLDVKCGYWNTVVMVNS